MKGDDYYEIGWSVLINEFRGENRGESRSSGALKLSSASRFHRCRRVQRKRKLALVFAGYYADERCRNKNRSLPPIYLSVVISGKKATSVRTIEFAFLPSSLSTLSEIWIFPFTQTPTTTSEGFAKTRGSWWIRKIMGKDKNKEREKLLLLI